jgi:hypothetical protein
MSCYTIGAIFIVMAVLGSLAFLGWCVWSLFWHLYDAHMEASLRIKNAQADREPRVRINPMFDRNYSVGSDCK